MIDAIAVFLGVYLYLWSKFFPPSEVEESTRSLLIEKYTLSLLLILIVIGYVVVRFGWLVPAKRQLSMRVFMVLAILFATVGLESFNVMYLRQLSTRPAFVHDSVIQLEEGIRFLLAGQNPYTEDYSDTPLSQWFYVNLLSDDPLTNPALPNLVYLPTLLYIGVAPYALLTDLFGWFDYRILNVVFWVLAGGALYALYDRQDFKLAGLVAFSLNPLFWPDVVWGANDVVVFGLVLWSLVFLKRKQIMLSLVVMALAVTTKHTAWFILPFYFFFLYKHAYVTARDWRKVVAFVSVILAILLPFLVWDWRSFLEDTFFNLLGLAPVSYPIAGYSFSAILMHFGLIDQTDAVPFWLLQVPIVMALLFVLLHRQASYSSLGRILLNFGFLLGISWFFSRYMHASHVGVVVTLLLIATLKLAEEQNYVSRYRFGTMPRGIFTKVLRLR